MAQATGDSPVHWGAGFISTGLQGEHRNAEIVWRLMTRIPIGDHLTNAKIPFKG